MADHVFLRGRDGSVIGPVSAQAVGVLFGTRVIDEATPVSGDGMSFARLDATPNVFTRADHARAEILEGRDPWGGVVQTGASGPVAAETDLTQASALKVMFGHAATKARGKLTFEAEDGRVYVTLSDGKITAISTDVSRLSLAQFLLAFHLVAPEDLEVAEESVDRFGGDLGGALIGLGLVPPHVYVEKFAEWAKTVLADVIGWEEGKVRFVPGDVTPPAIPLGFERYAALVEATRSALDKNRLMERLQPRWNLPLIPSSADGLTLDDLRLPPKDLRIIKSLDGSKTLADMCSKPGAETALTALYVIIEAGFATSGEDTLRPKDLEEAKKANETAATMKKKSPLEILGVKAEATDEEVRNKYMGLAKQYHPDGVRHGAALELVEARRHLFAVMQSAYESIETSAMRQEYVVLAQHGISTKAEEQAIVRAVIEAETLFKKSEILARMKKYGEALDLLDQAISRKPDDIEFKIHRSFFRYSSQKLDAETAIKEITVELKKQPNIAAGYLFLARLHKANDNIEGALKFYKKLLEHDPKNHEAESEIRLQTMRQSRTQKKKWL